MAIATLANIVRIFAELSDGSVVELTPNLASLVVATPPVAEVEEPQEAKPIRRRRKKAAPVEAPKVEVAPVEVPKVAEVEDYSEQISDEPPPANVVPTTSEESEKSDSKDMFFKLVKNCYGTGWYKMKGGYRKVAIHSAGTKTDGKPWYIILFIGKDGKWAYAKRNPDGSGKPFAGFWGIAGKLRDIKRNPGR